MMPGQPPQAYVDAYWVEVADELAQSHVARQSEIASAIAEYRAHMAPAGQTIYNRSPQSVAKSIVAHGLMPSVPPVGLCLQLTFELTDPKLVMDDPQSVALKVAGLIDDLSDYERTLGGAGLTPDGMESAPGQVWLYLRPVEAAGAMDRLKTVAAAVNAKVHPPLKIAIPDMRFPTGAVAYHQAA